ncbi:MAG: hypothetical protein ACREQI_01850 [Candidatus Binataceae bacterium]
MNWPSQSFPSLKVCVGADEPPGSIAPPTGRPLMLVSYIPWKSDVSYTPISVAPPVPLPGSGEIPLAEAAPTLLVGLGCAPLPEVTVTPPVALPGSGGAVPALTEPLTGSGGTVRVGGTVTKLLHEISLLAADTAWPGWEINRRNPSLNLNPPRWRRPAVG